MPGKSPSSIHPDPRKLTARTTVTHVDGQPPA
jgi:hypothetical protein